MREITSMPVYIFFKYYVLYYSHDEETLHSFIPRLYLRYKKGPDLNLVPLVHYLQPLPRVWMMQLQLQNLYATLHSSVLTLS